MNIKKIPALILLFGLCLLQIEASDPLSLEQKLKLKLIEEHWKDKEYSLARRQIEEYFSLFPETIAASHLHCMLGDLLFEEKEYTKALDHYSKISESSLIKKACEHTLFCYLMLKDFKKLKESVNYSTSQPLSLTSRRILAEGLFLEALETQDLVYKKDLLLLSEKEYRDLLGTSLEKSVLSPLAEIAKWNKNYAAAAELFLKLASLEEEKKSFYEYQAAKMLKNFNPQKALQLLDKIRWSGTELSFQATLKEIEILAATKNYPAIIHLIDEEIVTGANSSTIAILSYYQAKAYLCEARLEEAKNSLQSALSHKLLPLDIKKKSLLALVLCAKQLKDFSLADEAIKSMRQEFPKDPDLCSALLVHLGLAIEQNHLPQAKEDVALLRVIDESSSRSERYAIDEGILEAKMGNYEKAGDLFADFLSQKTPNPLFSEACKHLLKCCSHLMEESSEKVASRVENERLFRHISLVKKHSVLLLPTERENLSVVFAKSLSDQGKFSQALEELSITSFSSPHLEALSHLLAAKIHEKSGSPSSFIIHHLEKALEKESRFSQKAALHIRIFNITLASDEDKAADNLFQTFSLEPSRVQEPNVLWLAHYYFRKAHDHPLGKDPYQTTNNLIVAQRALRLFYTLLGWDGKDKFSVEPPKQNSLGQPLLHCARLLMSMNRDKEAKTLIEAFSKQMGLNKELLAEMDILLAKILEREKEYSVALKTLEAVFQAFPVANSKIGQKALLEHCRIVKSTNSFKDPNQKELQKLLSSLKLLEITRLDAFEPIGIEASLEGIEIKLSLTPVETRDELGAQLLGQLKNKYTSVAATLQQSSLPHHHKTAELLALYLIFIEERIKEFTRSEKGDTHDFGALFTQLKPLEQRSDADSELLRERVLRLQSDCTIGL